MTDPTQPTGSGGHLGLGDRAQWGAVLRSPFRNLLWATLTSSLGDWIGLVAILALTNSIMGSSRAAAFALSAIMVARVLPTMVLGPFAGVFADRWNRRRLMIGTDIGRGVIMALIPFSPDVWALFLATFAVEVMATLFIPAKDAALPSLVPEGHLVKANQLSMMAVYGTLPVGGFVYAAVVSVGGAMLPAWEFVQERPASLAIWANALTFFLSAWFVSRIEGLDRGPRAAGASEVEGPGAWDELKEGFRFIANQPLVRALVFGVMGASLAAGVVLAVGELYARVVNAGPSGFGILEGLVGSGLFAGIVAAGILERRIGKERLFAPGIGTAGAALAVTALMPRLDAAALPAILMGFGGGMAFITGYTLLQEHTADVIRGRTFAAFNTGVRFALFASLVVGPFIVGVVGPEAATRPGIDGPYSVGGVRITLLLAAAAALAGAVYSGRAIHRVLSAEDELTLTVTAPEEDRHGLFVVFEGGEGAGKSTQVRLLRAAVERAGHDAVVTREPGGTAIGEQLRDLVLSPATDGLADRAEALLYAAARAQHVEEVIRPALTKGAVVLCDRYVDSSVVYQGVARGLGDAQVAELNRWSTGDLQPDLVVLLDVEANEGLRRAGAQPDRLEAEGVMFHRRVNEAFRRRAAAAPERYLIVDGAAPVEEIHARIRAEVLARLEAR